MWRIYAILTVLIVLTGCAPAPPEWSYLQELYTDRYVQGERDCSNMAADYAMHCWQSGIPNASVIIGKRETVNHAWVRVRKGAKTWYVDPSADRWTTQDKWADNYDKTRQIPDSWIGRGDTWEGRYYKRNESGDVVEK